MVTSPNEWKILEWDEKQTNKQIYLILVIKWDDTLCISFQNVIDKTVEKYGRIDCLINNAGQRTYRMLSSTIVPSLETCSFSRLIRGSIDKIYWLYKLDMKQFYPVSEFLVNPKGLQSTGN